MTPSVLGHQLQLMLHLHQWPSMTSHCAEPQLLCMIPSCLQNQYHIGDSYTLPSPATAQGTTLAISGTQPLWSQKTHPRTCHLNDAGLFLITANFLAPTPPLPSVTLPSTLCHLTSAKTPGPSSILYKQKTDKIPGLVCLFWAINTHHPA